VQDRALDVRSVRCQVLRAQVRLQAPRRQRSGNLRQLLGKGLAVGSGSTTIRTGSNRWRPPSVTLPSQRVTSSRCWKTTGVVLHCQGQVQHVSDVL